VDCAACTSVCPVGAIFPDDEVPAEWASFTTLNADYFRDLAAEGGR